jgi:hypothetical protein
MNFITSHEWLSLGVVVSVYVLLNIIFKAIKKRDWGENP